MSLVLDAGALIAIDRRDRRVGAMLRVAQQERVVIRTSPAAVAQVWRHGSRQGHLARILAGVAAPPLDLETGRRLGTLLAATGGSDVVDAHVASLAGTGDQVLTSDPDDLGRLLDAISVQASVILV